MKWIVHNYSDTEECDDLYKAVKDNGHDLTIMDRNSLDWAPNGINEGDCVLFQGSIQMARHLRKVLPQSCYPIAFFNESGFDCDHYYEAVKGLLFNDKHVFTTVECLRNNVFSFYKDFAKEALIYIRPDRGDKPFTGQLLDLKDFDRFWDNEVACSAKPQDVVVVSTPKTIQGEWRFVCTDKKEIVAGSTYIYQGQKTHIPFYPAGATNCVEQVLERGYFPDPIFTVDVCQDADGNFWLLELNSFSCSGLYACNKNAIVKRASEIAQSYPVGK